MDMVNLSISLICLPKVETTYVYVCIEGSTSGGSSFYSHKRLMNVTLALLIKDIYDRRACY